MTTVGERSRVLGAGVTRTGSPDQPGWFRLLRADLVAWRLRNLAALLVTLFVALP
jgi:hypothetical protein